MLAQQSRKAFTLIELLLALGIIAILAAVTITAIAPSKQISDAKSAKHDVFTRSLHKAVQEYIIRNSSLPAPIPVGEENAKPICREGTLDSSCVSLDALVPEYLVTIPTDKEESNPLHSGYIIYQDASGQMRVTVPFN